jgi:hypothetical protein
LRGNKSDATDDLEVVKALAGALGITASLREPFACVLPGHAAHDAVLRPSGRGWWNLYCPGVGRGGIGLAETRAAFGYGRARSDLSATEIQKWRDRLEWEAGLRDWDAAMNYVRAAKEHLPPVCPRPAHAVAFHMALLIALRDPLIWPADVPVVFARDFATAYCQRTPDEIRSATRYLERIGYMRRAQDSERPRQPIQWMLAAQDAAAAAERRGQMRALPGGIAVAA